MKAITQATSGQKKQIARFLTDVLEKVAVEELIERLGLDNPSAQRVIEHGDEFAQAIRTAALSSIDTLSVSDNFKDQEVASDFGYLSGYTPYRDCTLEQIIDDFDLQVNKLDSIFNCGKCFDIDWLVKAHAVCPSWVEKFFALMPWWKIAPTYGEAVEKVLAMIKWTRDGKFFNFREGQLNPDKLRESTKSASGLQRLWQEQNVDRSPCSILVVPAQFGIRHRGRSVQRAREMFSGSEWGLGAFATGICLLLHEERLQDDDDLWIDCAGDKYAPDGDGDFSHTTVFRVNNGQLEFGAVCTAFASTDYGTASAFLPSF